jgi:hypothetical protein
MNLFVIGKNRISKMDRAGNWVNSFTIRQQLQSIDYDAATRRVLVTVPGKLLTFDDDLVQGPSIALPFSSRNPQIVRWNPVTKDIFVMSQGYPKVYRIRNVRSSYVGAGLIDLERTFRPMGFDFDNLGNLLVSENHALATFGPDGLRTPSRWDGLACGDLVRCGRSFDNSNAENTAFPAWQDIRGGFETVD